MRSRKVDDRKRDKRPSHLQSSDVHDQQSSTCSTDAPVTGNTEISNMAVHQLRDELKRRNAKGFSKGNKLELIKQLQEIYTLPGAPFSINSILEPNNGFWSEGIFDSIINCVMWDYKNKRRLAWTIGKGAMTWVFGIEGMILAFLSVHGWFTNKNKIFHLPDGIYQLFWKYCNLSFFFQKYPPLKS